MRKLVLLFLLCLATSMVFAQQKPRIVILATGGTIAGEGKSSDRAGYTAGKIPVSDLIGSIPTVNAIAEITGEQISSVGSQDMSLEIWKKLATRINEIVRKKEADGIVITHGTDTQEETAYFLNLVVSNDEIPVVLTGSMRPATAISADGPKNLFDAITVAADPKSKGRGVLVSFNESIYDAREVTKINTTKVNAFRSPNSGPLGEVYDGRVEYYKTAVRTIPNHFFEVNNSTILPKVEIVYMYADAAPDYIDYLVKQKVNGIVIAGVGNGNFSKAFTEAIKRATKANIAVCRASRSIEGRVVLDGETNDEELGTVVSDNLNPQKARILLMLGLTKTKNKKELQDYFFRF